MSQERIPIVNEEHSCDAACSGSLPDRRDFLFASGASVVAVLLPGAFPVSTQAQQVDYPQRNVGDLRRLREGQPVSFRYPWDHPKCENVLLKLGQQAAGGVGPNRDIVAFNRLCPHMGRSIPANKFSSETAVAGPCSWHWTTFDLTRHGMVISGHATQGLPQILLQVNGNNIVATGVMGLIYGFHNNRVNPNPEE